MRQRKLESWAHYLADAARSGALTGRPCPISRIETISGPRAGALEIFAGLESGRLFRSLSRNDSAALRQFIPWNFEGDPQCFMSGRYVRVEAGWPSDLAEKMIRLSGLGDHPHGGGRWVAGKSETGATVVPSLSDQVPHYLIAGTTGSGKSVALRSAILQLSADSDNIIVLIDGKVGESLRAVERLPGIVGPCAVEGPEVRAALGWTVAQMRQRYEAEQHQGRLIVVFDEFQEFAEDVVVADLLRKVAAQGRAAGVHLLAATQHPIVRMFGHPSTRRNLVGKIALRVGDADASRVALGNKSPRADHLLGAGDSYAVSPGYCHRVQLAYVDEREITAGERGGHSWRFQRFPTYDPESVGQELPSQFVFTGDELGVSLVSASEGEGRTLFTRRMKDAGLGSPGYPRQKRIRDLGRDALGWMRLNGYAICKYSPAEQQEGNVIIPSVW